ncbi:helix-turn-helix domain-containing protein [Zeaxanthinibacter enoshimensis]|uniref:Transcriptional regulator with XRE-family HTH domain n=1 Tax=Zeaxanthinibacter enoshimensis TaxID=392009 RepID=A0A4V3D455_9FLAO|nr:helix-turn-helix transcriptional regulator [Zeaxanthinibacter enoshimensis]TDQ33041.1 transcriptional regulator with XRE-family HTH domain [Zeaxanthinibacter enoshimensis]
MSSLIKFRELRNLTQEELSQHAGISVRTIQRIEAGTPPKGHTLKALAKALGVEETDLLPRPEETPSVNIPLMKLVNLSSLPVAFIPPLNILLPLTILLIKKDFNPVSKQLITVQILWSLAAAFVFVLSSFVGKWLSLGRVFMPAVMLLLALSNIFIILGNAAALDRKGRLYFRLNFSLF